MLLLLLLQVLPLLPWQMFQFGAQLLQSTAPPRAEPTSILDGLAMEEVISNDAAINDALAEAEQSLRPASSYMSADYSVLLLLL